MAKKTVFRRASKWVKLSPEQRDIIESDDDQYGFTDTPGKGASAAELASRLELACPTTTDEPEYIPPAEETESRIQGLLDMILTAQDIKGLDTAWAEVSDEAAKLNPSITEEEGQALMTARDGKKKEIGKRK